MVYHEATLKGTETAGEQGDYKLMHIYCSGLWKALDCLHSYEKDIALIPVSRAAGKSTFTDIYTANHAASVILSPVSGKRLQIAGWYWASDSAAGELHVYFATSSIDVIWGFLTKTSNASGLDCSITGAVNEGLTLASTQGDQKLFILINYRSID